MSISDVGSESATKPIDEERAALKAKGYTESEISSILVARRVGTSSARQHTSAPAGSAPLAAISASVAQFINSVWGKTLAILAALSIVMGIILELQSMVTGYYILQKTISETEIAQVNARYAKDIGKYP